MNNRKYTKKYGVVAALDMDADYRSLGESLTDVVDGLRDGATLHFAKVVAAAKCPTCGIVRGDVDNYDFVVLSKKPLPTGKMRKAVMQMIEAERDDE